MLTDPVGAFQEPAAAPTATRDTYPASRKTITIQRIGFPGTGARHRRRTVVRGDVILVLKISLKRREICGLPERGRLTCKRRSLHGRVDNGIRRECA